MKEEEELISVSQQVVGEKEYMRVRRNIKDSLSTWKNNNLSAYLALRLYPNKPDTIICFNQSADRLITALSFHCNISDCTQDDIWYFYGVKIKEKWYFFTGPAIVIIREAYGYPKNTPLPFTKLHEIAMQEVFCGYLKKKDLGFWRNVFGKAEYEVNEGWFKSHFEGPGWDRNCRTAECYEKLYLARVQNNWKHRDTTNYKP